MSSREELFNLLQNQAELMGLLREPIKNEKDLLKAKQDLSDHNNFINQIGRVSTRLQLPLEIVFQCLMHMSTLIFDHAGASSSKGSGGNRTGAPADFDRQHRHGNVPMHQAKVLKREGLTEIQPKLEAAVPEDKLREMIHFSSSLRSLVRMKVEDGNDLSMARKAISYADDYMQRIYNLSRGNSQVMWKMFNAVDDRELASLIQQANGGGDMQLPSSTSSTSLDAGSNNNNTFGTLGGTLQGGMSTTAPVPPPRELISAVDSTCKKSLLLTTTAVADRQGALANLEAWFRSYSLVKDDDDYEDDYEDEEDDYDNDDDDQQDHEDSAMTSNTNKSTNSSKNSKNNNKFTPDLIRAVFASPSFRRGITNHVGEKRSALCRTACDIVSILLQNVSELNIVFAPSGMSEIRESLVAWLEVLLKQVHITVAAIATATDACVRDMFVATGGHLSLMNLTSQVASSASQPELQRKCIGFLALGVVSHLHTFDASEVDPAAKCSVIATACGKLLKSSSEAVRRAARVAGTVCQRVHPSIGIPGWDERVEKAAAGEAFVVASAAEAGTLEFECSALKYSEPCPVSQHCPNKHECTISLLTTTTSATAAGSHNNNNIHHQNVLSATASASSSSMMSSSSSSLMSSSSKSIHHQNNNNNQSNNNNNRLGGAIPSTSSLSGLSVHNSNSTTGKFSSGGSSSRIDSLAQPKKSATMTSGTTRVPLSTSSATNNNGVGVGVGTRKPGTSSSSSASLSHIAQQRRQISTANPTSTTTSSSNVNNGNNHTHNFIPVSAPSTTTTTTSKLRNNITNNNTNNKTTTATTTTPTFTSNSATGTSSSTMMPLSLAGFQQQQQQQPSMMTMMRGREPASPNTEAFANRGIVPGNSAATSNNNNNNNQQQVLSDTLRRKIHSQQQQH